jgi:hypothetical protein
VQSVEFSSECKAGSSVNSLSYGVEGQASARKNTSTELEDIVV